jgi:hypothetical protein
MTSKPECSQLVGQVPVQDVTNPVSLSSFYCMQDIPFLFDPLKYTGCFIVLSD